MRIPFTSFLGASFLIAGLAACSPNEMGSETKAITASDAALNADSERIRAHMAFLASDELEGREAGTEGYDIAADYVADELRKLGLAPAGEDGTYLQTVPLRRAYRVADALSLTVVTPDGTPIQMEENVDFAMGANTRFEESSVTAEAVFVGFGIVAPDLGRDDFAGVDVEGKIVVALARTPSGIQTEERAYYGRQKIVEASKRGAIGFVTLETPVSNRIYAFGRLVGEGRLDSASMGWLQPDGTLFSRSPNIEVGATLSLAGAEKLFQDTPMTWDEVIAAAEVEGGLMPAFDLPVIFSMAQKSTHDVVQSPNVAGILRGSDPELADEFIVLSAHLDHIGISKTIEADKINNGALDNAAGIATTLEAARLLASGEPPRRSVLFVAVTAEEKGLLGAQYFAQNPTVPAEHIVGNVNLDMPVLTYDFQDVVAFGSDRSTMGPAVSAAAETLGLTLAEDPFPAQGLFTRSDHFRFVEIGVPSVFLATGFANGGEEAWATHFAKHYHRPSDDMENAINFEAAAKFADVNVAIATTLANADERPLWKSGDFFARQFGGPMLEE